MLPQYLAAAQVKFLHNSAGLYIHIPFCEKKCAYCDFYSAFVSEDMLDKYMQALYREITKWGGILDRPIDTIYIGGGTPSLLGERIVPLIKRIRENFEITDDAEITAEVNPGPVAETFLPNAKRAGVNRISIGAQSGDNAMLKILGRTHTAEDTKRMVSLARSLGFSNISLDLMIGLPQSTVESLGRDIDFIKSLSPEHISAYILKLEPDTAFGRKCEVLGLPDDEGVAEQYLYMCEHLEGADFCHYEISNFSKNGFESRHNLKYWLCKEYLGIGPAAHSFIDNRRFYYPRDLHGFLKGADTVFDGEGGDPHEKLMLSLRLKRGINLEDIYSSVPKEVTDRAERLCRAGLINYEHPNISLTNEGMLLSNSVILELTV